jgi:peptide/nickel transport system substrate-binding protein
MNNSPRRRLLLAASLVTLGLVGAACSGTANQPAKEGDAAAFELTSDTPDAAGDIDSFTWALYAEPFSLDYAYAFDYPPNTVLANVCESLLRWNPDLSYSPGLAEKVDHPSPTSWVYTIRQGVTFHDGTTLTADDVVASLQRHLEPRVGSYWASAYRNVKSIEKTGDNEVTVALTRPDSLFNQYMAASPGTIESAATLAAGGADYGNSTTGVNCTGPFSLKSWDSGNDITLERYADYWDEDLQAKAGEVKFVFLPDSNTRVNAWASGQVDGGWQVPSNAFAQLEGSDTGSLYYGVNTAVTSEIISNTQGVLGDPRVRQALLMAMDREGIVKAGEQGVAEVADSLVTRSTWGGASGDELDTMDAALPKYPHDVAAAKELAAEAGVDGQEIVLATSPVFSASDVATNAVAQAAKDIGLKPKIETISPEKYTALFSDPAARKGIDMFLTIWYTSITDPMDFYGVLQTGEFSNYGGYSNADFDKAVVAAGSAEVDDPKRTALIGEAQKIAMEELPWLPMYTAPTAVWLGERITGVEPSISFMYYPWAATIGAR